MTEQEIVDELTESVRQTLEWTCGLYVVGLVDVQYYQRWDRHAATITIKASVTPRA